MDVDQPIDLVSISPCPFAKTHEPGKGDTGRARLWLLFTVCFAGKINIPAILHYLQLVNLSLASVSLIILL